MPRTLERCKHCGEEEYADVLFKGLCAPCLDELHPGRVICELCGEEWATYAPTAGVQAPATCDNCADDGAFLAICLGG